MECSWSFSKLAFVMDVFNQTYLKFSFFSFPIKNVSLSFENSLIKYFLRLHIENRQYKQQDDQLMCFSSHTNETTIDILLM